MITITVTIARLNTSPKKILKALHSPGHPDLTMVPKTEAATAGKKRKAKEVSAGIKKN